MVEIDALLIAAVRLAQLRQDLRVSALVTDLIQDPAEPPDALA